MLQGSNLHGFTYYFLFIIQKKKTTIFFILLYFIFGRWGLSKWYIVLLNQHFKIFLKVGSEVVNFYIMQLPFFHLQWTTRRKYKTINFSISRLLGLLIGVQSAWPFVHNQASRNLKRHYAEVPTSLDWFSVKENIQMLFCFFPSQNISKWNHLWCVIFYGFC